MTYCLWQRIFFFPEGKSKSCELSEVSCNILDFTETSMPDDITIGEIYDFVKMGIVRFYLSTERVEISQDFIQNSEAVSDINLQTNSSTEVAETEIVDILSGAVSKVPYQESQLETNTIAEVGGTEIVGVLSGTVLKIPDPDSQLQTNTSAEVAETEIVAMLSGAVPKMPDPDSQLQTNTSAEVAETEIVAMLSGAVPKMPDPDSQLQTNTSADNRPLQMPTIPDMYYPNEYDTYNTIDIDEEIQFSFGYVPSVYDDEDTMNDTVTHVPVVQVIEVRRGFAFEDILKFFKNTDFDLRFQKIEIRMIDQNGKPEAGEDNGGVLRDALTEFWNEFYLRYTLGSDSKIPVVTHTLDENSWKSIGKIIVIGYNQVGYFPVQISRPFITKCITGSEGCSDDELQNSFLNSMNSTDQDVIKNALNGAFVLDDVLDALETYDVKINSHH